MDGYVGICGFPAAIIILICIIIMSSIQIETKNRLDGWPNGTLIINNKSEFEINSGASYPYGKIWSDCKINNNNCHCVVIFPYGNKFLYRPSMKVINKTISIALSKNEVQMKWDPNFDCSEIVECVIKYHSVDVWIGLLITCIILLVIACGGIFWCIFYTNMDVV